MLTEDIDAVFDPVKIAHENPQSRRAGIRGFCCTCVGGIVPNWRNEIRGCTARECPLYPHRPYKPSVDKIVAI